MRVLKRLTALSESAQPADVSTLAAIRAALEAAGVRFIDQNGEGSGVRLRKSTTPGHHAQQI